MQKAYIGESFELVFDISDPKDPERIVDSASYRVIAPDGSISQAGIMSISPGRMSFVQVRMKHPSRP